MRNVSISLIQKVTDSEIIQIENKQIDILKKMTICFFIMKIMQEVEDMIDLAVTKYGTYQSVRSNAGFALFRGIAYAKPPIRDRRWKAPEDIEPFEGVKLCDKYGNACAQYDRWDTATDDINDDSGHPYIRIENYPYPPMMSEDCLYLNIYTPAENMNSKLPVMIYIHGGGLQQWYGSDYEYCGDNFCRNGVILVSINYRLNVFGYFCHPELKKESEHNASGNYGLMDQIKAVKWVRDNIEAFGGDPHNLTVFGQSAGGRSSLAVVCSPLSEHAISHVSIQSAGGLGNIMRDSSYETQEKMGIDFMKMCGCDSLEEMRKLDWQTLRDFNDRLGIFKGFNMCTDGYVLPEDIETMIVNNTMDDIDVIIGCTADEGVNEKEPMFGTNTFAQVRAFAKTKYLNNCKKSFVYVFDRKQPGDDAGVSHSCDNRYQFGTLDGSWRPYTKEDYDLSKQMTAYWSSFAKSGDPNGEGLPNWDSYDEEEKVMKLCVEGPHMEKYEDRKLKELTEEMINSYKK